MQIEVSAAVKRTGERKQEIMRQIVFLECQGVKVEDRGSGLLISCPTKCKMLCSMTGFTNLALFYIKKSNTQRN